MTANLNPQSLMNTRLCYSHRGQEGDLQRALSCFSAVIKMPGVPAHFKARGFVDRGRTYSQRGQKDNWRRMMDDYSAVIDMPDAPANLKALGFLERGLG